MKAHQVLSSINNWSANYFATDENDKPVSWTDLRAVKFCFQGVLHRLYSPKDLEVIYKKIYKTPEFNEELPLTVYNRVWGWGEVYKFLLKYDI